MTIDNPSLRLAILVTCLSLAACGLFKNKQSHYDAGIPSAPDAATTATKDASSPVPVPPSHAEVVVAGLRPAFKRCYNDGLSKDSSMAGKIVILIRVEPNGDVDGVSKESGSGLSEEVERCIMDTARGAKFGPGAGGTVKVPVTFVAS